MSHARARAGSRLWLYALGSLLAVYLVAPVVAFVVRDAGSGATGLPVPGLLASFGLSALTATVSTLVIALAGLPLAFLCWRHRSRAWRLVEFAVLLPLAVPPLVGGLLLDLVVGPGTALGRLFGGGLTDSAVGIVLAQLFVAAPFLLAAALLGFSSVPEEVVDGAQVLGHGEHGLCWRVAVPAARGEITLGLTLAWLRGFGEYGATTVLAPRPATLSVFAAHRLAAGGVPAAKAAVLLALAVALCAALLTRVRWPLPVRRYREPERVFRPRAAATRPLRFAIAWRAGDFELDLVYRGRACRLAILGAAGSGRTTALRCLAGLEGDATVHIELGTEELGSLAAGDRGVGYLTGRDALAAHLSVARQVGFGVGAAPESVHYWIERLGLTGLVDRSIDGLTPLERRRVALARALSREPALVLLDELFDGLDRASRAALLREVRALQRETGVASIVATDDFDEAASLADEILVIDGGRLLQAGSARECYFQPASARVAYLVGVDNLQRGVAEDARSLVTGSVRLSTGEREITPGARVLWSVDPDDLVVGIGDANYAEVVDLHLRAGHRYARLVFPDGVEFVARVGFDRAVAVGQLLALHIPSDAILILRTDPPT